MKKTVKRMAGVLAAALFVLNSSFVSPAEELQAEVPVSRDDVVDEVFDLNAGVSPRVIWGSDQLQIVDEEHRRQYPFSAVVAITAEFNDAAGQSTGFMIGRNTILTCGHCVYDPEYGGLCTSLEFYPGSDNESRPFGTFQASPSNVSIHPVWLESAQKAGTGEDWYGNTEHGFDMAVIRIDDNVGDMTGWFGLKWQEGSLNGVHATLTGYPKGYRMKTANGIIMDTEAESLIYQIDSEPGTSGCPIYMENRDGSLSVIGVNKSSMMITNQASRITKEKFDWIVSQAAPGDEQLITEYGKAAESGAGAADYSMANFSESMYAGNWREVVKGYKAYVPGNWTESGTTADHIYSVSNGDDELFMAVSTADASISTMATDLLEILSNSESLDPFKLLGSSGDIIDFFSDISNWGDTSGSLTGDIIINGIDAKTNSLYTGNVYLQAIRFKNPNGDVICLIAGNLSDGKISPNVTNILDSFQAN